MLHHADDIVHVCAALCNLKPLLIKAKDHDEKTSYATKSQTWTLKTVKTAIFIATNLKKKHVFATVL